MRTLELDRAGFPLAGPGRYREEGELPWVFDEIAPDGFLAGRFAGWFPELSLPPLRTDWSAAHVLAAISRRGHDLAGNLIIGEESYDRYRQIFTSSRRPGPRRDEAVRYYGDLVEQVLSDPSGSSVGGSRPKFALRLDDGRGLIVKFTPPLETEAGRRWADLLRMEAHAAATLREAGIDAVQAGYLENADRGFLEIERFDRTVGGRIGHVTLYYLALSRYGEVSGASAIVRRLVDDDLLEERDAQRFERIDAFSRGIGNTDTHLGNYGLLIDDDGHATLAPAYDVLPMAFAPQHDELPDRRVRHSPATDADTQTLIQALIASVEGDPGISEDFKRKWLAITT
jgi:hypothetical protein